MTFAKYYIKRTGPPAMYFNRYQWAWQFCLTGECFYFTHDAASSDSLCLEQSFNPLVVEVADDRD